MLMNIDLPTIFFLYLTMHDKFVGSKYTPLNRKWQDACFMIEEGRETNVPWLI
jgi:hypothetical protein